MKKIYANKTEVERAGICHRNSVDSWINKGKIEEVIIVGGSLNGSKMYLNCAKK